MGFLSIRRSSRGWRLRFRGWDGKIESLGMVGGRFVWVGVWDLGMKLLFSDGLGIMEYDFRLISSFFK